MSLDEAPQNVELLVEWHDEVVLLEVLRRSLVGSSRLVLLLLGLALALDDAFSDSDILRVLEREASEILDRFGLGRREEESLALPGKVGHDGVDGGGESHVENAVGLVEYCRFGR